MHRGDELALEFTDQDGLADDTYDPEVAHRYLYGAAVDQILAVEDGSGGVLWGLGDHQGTIRDVVDSAGELDNHVEYDAFGRITGGTASADFLFTFTGRPYDPDTGLYDYRARWYDADVGRFVSEDPAGLDAGDVNLYRYAGNSPVVNVDPSGLCFQGVMGALGRALKNAASYFTDVATQVGQAAFTTMEWAGLNIATGTNPYTWQTAVFNASPSGVFTREVIYPQVTPEALANLWSIDPNMGFRVLTESALLESRMRGGEMGDRLIADTYAAAERALWEARQMATHDTPTLGGITAALREGIPHGGAGIIGSGLASAGRGAVDVATGLGQGAWDLATGWYSGLARWWATAFTRPIDAQVDWNRQRAASTIYSLPLDNGQVNNEVDVDVRRFQRLGSAGTGAAVDMLEMPGKTVETVAALSSLGEIGYAGFHLARGVIGSVAARASARAAPRLAPSEGPVVFEEVPNAAIRQRPSTLRPGRYARQSVPLEGLGQGPTAAQQRAINAIGNKYGCHTCGSVKPGTQSGNWILDHQPPTAMTLPGQSQVGYPHCLGCSEIQGGQVRAWQQ